MLGAIILFTGMIIPPEYMEAKGQCLNRDNFYELSELLHDGDYWPYGRCNNEIDFKLPDLRSNKIDCLNIYNDVCKWIFNRSKTLVGKHSAFSTNKYHPYISIFEAKSSKAYQLRCLIMEMSYAIFYCKSYRCHNFCFLNTPFIHLAPAA